MQQTTQAYLIIQLGSRWTDVLRLNPDQSVVVGRSSECQISVKNERASRQHARIYSHGGGWWVEDLGSRNGTAVGEGIISEPTELSDGDNIEVAGCTMTFSQNLAGGFGGPGSIPIDYSLGQQQTEEVRPTILNRMSNSQYSADDLKPPSLANSSPRAASVANVVSSKAQGTDHWSFFYRLVSELVGKTKPESVAQSALDQLIARLGISAGGVMTIEIPADGDDVAAEDATAKESQPSMAVVATRQATGGSYSRVSDFLVRTVTQERQAVLARNVRDDSKLSLARASGQREVVSVICAPIRDISHGERPQHEFPVVGMLHVYSAGDERMLTDADLEVVVGVADNIGIAWQRLREQEQLSQTLESSRRRAELLEEQLGQTNVLIGASDGLNRVKASIERAGPTQATVLVRGESGVGKELVARAIHACSTRKDGPLVCLNCAALAPTLLESELFGHEKGAFTGATERKIGKFEAADQGTILLDEIGEMSAELQAKFLRVLEGQPFERLGGHKPIQTDVRVIAATNRHLEEAVEEKQFRADLYYRLRVIEIDVPPLRDRLEDVPLLVEHFMDQLKHHAGRRIDGVSPEALEMLTRHSWPGNVRELRNVVERAIVLGAASTIGPRDLSLSTLGQPAPSATSPEEGQEFQPISLAELEKRHIFRMLEHAEGNKTRASQLLGIERSTLDRKLKRFKKDDG